jgi:hypothetical protein
MQHFFFGIKNELLNSEIQIPLFQNRKFKSENLQLYKCFPEKNKWIIEKISQRKINDYFFILKEEDISNKDIFFLADNDLEKKFNNKILENYRDFTIRANLKIYLRHGGFSSYQSDYPYSMINKLGTILSPVSSLCNSQAEKNYIIIRNIFEKPIEEKFKAYLINYNKKKIEKEYDLQTNFTNILELDKELIKPEIFIVTEKYIGIPMFVSLKNKFISFEHTLPPHEYIFSKNVFKIVTKLKKEMNEIINK